MRRYETAFTNAQKSPITWLPYIELARMALTNRQSKRAEKLIDYSFSKDCRSLRELKIKKKKNRAVGLRTKRRVSVGSTDYVEMFYL